MPKKTTATDQTQLLNLKAPTGALQLPPPVRKPSRGALGGAAPRSGRTRLPPEMAASGRGGKQKAAAKKKGAK